MRTDLHTHTNASDANLSRRQLLEIAAARELDRIAITDHDTMKNSFSAEGDAVEVIPACELSAYDELRGARVHLLCYLPKNSLPLREHFDLMSQKRREVGAQMLEMVHRRYPVVNEQNIAKFCAFSGEVHRQNIMSVLMEYGYTTEMFGPLYHELFDRKTGSCHVGMSYRNIQQLLQTAHDARGVVVLAHPSVFHTMELAQELAAGGSIDGIEIDHPRNLSADRAVLEALCERYSLFATGGSDYHGANSSGHVLPGDGLTGDAAFERLMECSTIK